MKSLLCVTCCLASLVDVAVIIEMFLVIECVCVM